METLVANSRLALTENYYGSCGQTWDEIDGKQSCNSITETSGQPFMSRKLVI